MSPGRARIRRRALAGGLALLALSAQLLAAPERSSRPVPRPDRGITSPAPEAWQAGAVEALLSDVLRQEPPPARPDPAKIAQAASNLALATLATAPAALPMAIARSPRPVERPGRRPRPVAVAGPSGAVCGAGTIIGTPVAPVTGRLAACGIAAPVRVTSVAGVALTSPALIDCATARALETWVSRGVKPAVGRKGGGVARLKVIASYSCRTRNSRKGAKISEHARGHAVDVAGVVLKNGREISVARDWRSRYGKVLRAMHKSACGIFGTVLGPEADRYHQDHLHLDTARYRSGAYCR